jgi:mannose-P-dolichol utilization defect 1
MRLPCGESRRAKFTLWVSKFASSKVRKLTHGRIFPSLGEVLWSERKMVLLTEIPAVVAFADWVWGADPSEEISPDICLRNLPFLNGGCLSGLLVKGIGIAIIVGACLNKAPVIRNIIKSKSAAGFTLSGIGSDLLVVSNCSFYGILNRQPITAYGENVALAIQCIIISLLVWKYKDDPKVTTEQKVMSALVYVIYVNGVIFFLPENMYYLLMTTVWPLALYGRGSQIYEAFRLKHSGSNALLTHLMNFVGSSIRILTTIKEVGWDMAMLGGFFLSVTTNGIIIIQFWWYRDNTSQFLREQEEKKKA